MSLFTFLFGKPALKEDRVQTAFRISVDQMIEDILLGRRTSASPSLATDTYEPVPEPIVQVVQVQNNPWLPLVASAASLYTAYSVNKKMNELQEKLKQAEATKPKYDLNTGLRKYV